MKVDDATAFTPAPSPRLGENTDEVLTRLLEHPPARVVDPRATGVVA